MECSGGTPSKFVIFKKPYVFGMPIKAGTIVQLTTKKPLMTDEEVAAACNSIASIVCKVFGNWHITYYYVNNSQITIEAKALIDTTITPEQVEEGTEIYILQTIPIWLLIATVGGLAAFILLLLFSK